MTPIEKGLSELNTMIVEAKEFEMNLQIEFVRDVQRIIKERFKLESISNLTKKGKLPKKAADFSIIVLGDKSIKTIGELVKLEKEKNEFLSLYPFVKRKLTLFTRQI